MASVLIDWYKLAYKNSFRDPAEMLKHFRSEEQLSYNEIAVRLKMTIANVRRKCYELLALGRLTAKDLRMKDEMAQHIVRNLAKTYPQIANKVRRMGRRP